MKAKTAEAVKGKAMKPMKEDSFIKALREMRC